MVELGIPEKNFIYIPNGADIDRFKPSIDNSLRLREKFGVNVKKYGENKNIKCPVLLFVGRFEYQHAPMQMIEIFDKLQKLNPVVQLLAVGDGKLREECMKRAEKLKNIKFIQKIPYAEIHEAFQASDFFFLNSIYTGQSLAMLEAMASGCILLVPNHTEFQRIVTDAKVGYTYDQENEVNGIVGYKNLTQCHDLSTRIASGICKYMQEINIEAEQQKLRAYAESNLGWASVAKRYLKYFFG
jgi:glycosyltransferase involved in cell wall biosynthesis